MAAAAPATRGRPGGDLWSAPWTDHFLNLNLRHSNDMGRFFVNSWSGTTRNSKRPHCHNPSSQVPAACGGTPSCDNDSNPEPHNAGPNPPRAGVEGPNASIARGSAGSSAASAAATDQGRGRTTPGKRNTTRVIQSEPWEPFRRVLRSPSDMVRKGLDFKQFEICSEHQELRAAERFE